MSVSDNSLHPSITAADVAGMRLSAPFNKIKPADLPVPPQSALEIVRACARDDISHLQLAEYVERDVILCTEVLRTVNSPLYGFGQEICSIPQAITLLGLRALRNMVLCLMVRDLMQRHTCPPLVLTQFWEDALRRALAAKSLAAALRLDPDECFTAGLLQDLGLLVLFHLNPLQAHHYAELRNLDPIARRTHELTLFSTSHDRLILMLGTHWSLPTSLIQAIANHHVSTAGNSAAATLAAALTAADWVDAVFHVTPVTPVLKQTRRQLAALGLNDPDIDRLFSALPAVVEQAAQSLGLHIAKQTDFTQILRTANAALVRENLTYQERAWQLEKAIAQRDQQAAALTAELHLAQEIQQQLMPQQHDTDLPIAAVNLPAGALSGDFYDYLVLPDGRLYFTLGDVAGKGVNAALLMVKACSLFRLLAKQGHKPEKILAMLNDEIYETTIRGLFVTMIIGVYHPNQQQIVLANAGHPPALWINAQSQLQTYAASASPLGIQATASFAAHPPIAMHGAALYLYSDGVIEAQQHNGQAMGLDGVIELAALHAQAPADEQLQHIVAAIDRENSRDDITILILHGR